MQREVTHGLWEKIQADEDCADNEELWELPELYHSEATHPTLQLRHIRDAGSQSAGIPRLRAGECGWKYIGSTYQYTNAWIPCQPQLSSPELAVLSTVPGTFSEGAVSCPSWTFPFQLSSQALGCLLETGEGIPVFRLQQPAWRN